MLTGFEPLYPNVCNPLVVDVVVVVVVVVVVLVVVVVVVVELEVVEVVVSGQRSFSVRQLFHLYFPPKILSP